jgi:hypothetical protein
MNGITETPVAADEATNGPIGDESWAIAQTGAVSFSEVVRAHFNWDRAGCPDGEAVVFSVEAISPRRRYVVCSIELGSRRAI